MDNKTVYHICGEAIVIAGLSAYFFKQNKALQEQITQLHLELEKQKKENEKVFSTIFNVLETHLSPRQAVPQVVPQPAVNTVRKRNVEVNKEKVKSAPIQQPILKKTIVQAPVKEEEEEAVEEVNEIIGNEDIQEEMNSLLRDDEEDIETIDITKPSQVPQDMVVLVASMNG